MQELVKITTARSLLAKHDHFVLHKNRKLSKSRRLIHFCTCILDPYKVVALKCGEKAQNLDTFRVGHREGGNFAN